MIPAWAEAVPIQRCADQFAVGEAYGRGAVPGFHHRGVVLIEPAPVQVHLGIADPRFGDEHHHRMRQRTAARHEELECIIEAGGITLLVVHDWEQLRDVFAEKIGLQPSLARAHPIDVALQRVDLAVVADIAIGVSQGPGRERVGAEPRMDQRERAAHCGFVQIDVVLRHLVRQQQTFIDDGVAGEARDVEVFTAFDHGYPHGIFRPLADHVELALELRRRERAARDEDLSDYRLGPARLNADRVAVYRYIAPAQEMRVFFGDDLLEELFALAPLRRVAWQEHHSHAVLAGAREFHMDIGRCLLQKCVGNLKKNAGAVSRARVAALRAPVKQIIQHLQSLADDVMRGDAFDIGDEADAATVLLVCGIIEALLRG